MSRAGDPQSPSGQGGLRGGVSHHPHPPAHSWLAKCFQPQMNWGSHFSHRFYPNTCPKYMKINSFISICLSSSLLTNWHRSRNQDGVLPSSYQPGESHHIFKLPFSKTIAARQQCLYSFVCAVPSTVGLCFQPALSTSGTNRTTGGCNLCLEMFVNGSVSIIKPHRKPAAIGEVGWALSNSDIQIYSRLLASSLI